MEDDAIAVANPAGPVFEHVGVPESLRANPAMPLGAIRIPLAPISGAMLGGFAAAQLGPAAGLAAVVAATAKGRLLDGTTASLAWPLHRGVSTSLLLVVRFAESSLA